MRLKKRTVSISKNTLPAMFRALADILEDDSELAEELRRQLVTRIPVNSKEYPEIPGFFDAKVSDEQVRALLGSLSIETLVGVVQGYALDSSRSFSRQKDPAKIIDFIMTRRRKLLTKYRGFEDISPDQEQAANA